MSLLARLVPYPAETTTRSDGKTAVTQGGPAEWSVRKVWRWLASKLADYHWWILLLSWIAAFALGCWGWWTYSRLSGHTTRSYADAAYMSLRDFFINAPDFLWTDKDKQIPSQLYISLFLAPAVAGWATLSALGLLFRDRMQQMRISFMRRHVVMCGLGKYVGLAFLRDLRQKRIPVVVIESDAANPNIGLCRSLGVPVLLGDAQRRRTLEAARAHRASRVLVVSADDAVNTQIVATWRQLEKRRPHQRRCLARISAPEFGQLLWIQELQRGDLELSVDFFNIDEIGARLLLQEHPINTDCDQPHILVAHLDPLGEWLIYHAARAWHDSRGDKKKTVPLAVTILDENPQERKAALLGRHVALGDETVCHFTELPANNKNIDELRQPAAPPLSAAYVTAYHDHEALKTALKLRHVLGRDIPVVVALSRPRGVAGLLDDVTEEEESELVNIKVFSSMERSCTAELVQGGSFELMAHAIHERWRTDQGDADGPPITWEALDDSRKQSNRAQARDIPRKLKLVDCGITPLRKWDLKDFTFTKDEIEKLAIEEHGRWNAERIADGWTLDLSLKKGDPVRKRTPYLVPWGDLPPNIAKYDTDSVEAIPRILASAGMQVVRKPELTHKAT